MRNCISVKESINIATISQFHASPNFRWVQRVRNTVTNHLIFFNGSRTDIQNNLALESWLVSWMCLCLQLQYAQQLWVLAGTVLCVGSAKICINQSINLIVVMSENLCRSRSTCADMRSSWLWKTIRPTSASDQHRLAQIFIHFMAMSMPWSIVAANTVCCAHRISFVELPKVELDTLSLQWCWCTLFSSIGFGLTNSYSYIQYATHADHIIIIIYRRLSTVSTAFVSTLSVSSNLHTGHCLCIVMSNFFVSQWRFVITTSARHNDPSLSTFGE